MRTTALAVIVALLTCFFPMSSSAFAQEATEWHKVAQEIELGSKVNVQLLDGKHVNGTLMRVDESSVMVKKNTRRPEPAVAIPFDQVVRLERDRGGMSIGKAVAIAAATGAGIMVTLFVIALQLD
jgi:hypothetical protein